MADAIHLGVPATHIAAADLDEDGFTDLKFRGTIAGVAENADMLVQVVHTVRGHRIWEVRIVARRDRCRSFSSAAVSLKHSLNSRLKLREVHGLGHVIVEARLAPAP
jgi:hypothetical protein